ncbi:phosphonatase-like hydrolase [Endozoicomonas arenosclerae]|uniref:phosphonatase-like hydrolase n=1 Tax=Endozoicomonas arenosclerae TaxID=1633495 RepID=UPI000783AD48|nr:phosphonatase-like hydrolase [Endozoicomonas arenosclerae]
MSNIKLAVFDMAGTTVDEDNVVYKTVNRSLTEAGYEFTLEDVLEHGAGKEKHQAIKDVLASKGFNNADSEQIFQAFKNNLERAYSELAVTTFEGVEELLKELRKREIKITLNTGYSYEVATKLLSKMNWQAGSQFDVLVTADDVTNGRPAPDMILLAMEKTGISASAQVLKAGDSAIDIHEGKNAHCGITVGVTTGAQTREQLLTAEPTFVFDNLADILQHI